VPRPVTMPAATGTAGLQPGSVRSITVEMMARQREGYPPGANPMRSNTNSSE